MEQSYTDNRIIKLIYGDCDLFERLETEYAIATDAAMREQYYTLYNAYKALPKVTFSPRKKTIQSILKMASV